MKLGLALFVAGVALLGFGVFFLFDRGVVSGPSFILGLAVSAIALLRLGWAAARGSLLAALVAGLDAAILTWTVYEMVRQTPGMPSIGILGEMTAPVLSTTVGLLVAASLAIGLRRRQGTGAIP